MKKLQEGVLQRTLTFHGRQTRKEPAADLSAIEKRVLQRLSEEQRKLGEVMDRFIKKFEEEKREFEKGRDQGISFQDEQRTPGQATQALREIHKLMGIAEELLQGANAPKSAAAQKDVIARLVDLIKKAKARGQPQQGDPQPSKQSSLRATSPYDPGRTNQPSKFHPLSERRGNWGDLSPKQRVQMMHELEKANTYLPEYTGEIEKWLREIMKYK
jgi:ElaB/YqjD/DUF883 family membrane-anchored ribosome-binding protein